MRIATILRTLSESLDPLALILGSVLFVVFILLSVRFGIPFLLFTLLLIGSLGGARLGALNALGLIGKYPILILLACVGIAYKGPYRISWASGIYLIYCTIQALELPRSSELMLFDTIVIMIFNFLMFFGIIMLVGKYCAEEENFKSFFFWVLVWAFVMVWIQVPFGQMIGGRWAGIYQWAVPLMNILNKCILILILFILSGQCPHKWFLPTVATIIVGFGLLLLTAGRTAVGTTVLSIPFVLLMRPKKGLIIAVLVGGLGFWALTTVLPYVEGFDWISRRLTLTTTSGREEQWVHSWGLLQNNLLFGYGGGRANEQALGQYGISLHSAYLMVALDYGIIVAGMYFAVLFGGVVRGLVQIVRTEGTLRQMTVMSGSFFVVMTITSFLAGDIIGINLQWFFLCICIGLQDAVALRINQMRQIAYGEESYEYVNYGY